MKKGYYFFYEIFSQISLHAPILALNKWMRASDDEQGINKLRPYLIIFFSRQFAMIFFYLLLQNILQ